MLTNVRYYFGINDYIATIFGMFCNIFLALIILKTKNVELVKYNRILLQAIFADLFLSIMTFITRPIVVTFKSTESLIPNPFVDVDEPGKVILLYVWVIALFYSICTVPISFYYRYRILCKNKCFSIKLQVFLLLLALFFSVTYSIHGYYAFTDRTRQFIARSEELLAPWFADIDGKVKVAGFVGYFDYYVYIFMTHAAIVTSGAYFIIIWCSWKVYKLMKSHQQIGHKNFVDIHHQLTKTLIAQALIPLFTFATPIIFIIITVTTPIYINPVISAGIAASFSYIPLGNALSIFFFVKSYKKQGYLILKNSLAKLLHKHASSTVITINVPQKINL